MPLSNQFAWLLYSRLTQSTPPHAQLNAQVPPQIAACLLGTPRLRLALPACPPAWTDLPLPASTCGAAAAQQCVCVGGYRRLPSPLTNPNPAKQCFLRTLSLAVAWEGRRRPPPAPHHGPLWHCSSFSSSSSSSSSNSSSCSSRYSTSTYNSNRSLRMDCVHSW